MSENHFSELVEQLMRGDLSRRAFIKRAIAAGASASVISTALARAAHAAPSYREARSRRRAQSDPRTLVVLDDLQGQNWLYLDPGRIFEINPIAAQSLIYESLYHLPDANDLARIEPLLAEGMPEVSDDGLTATIRIRQGVKFHNTGNVMTADDWVFSWNRLANLKGNGSFLFTDYIERVEAVDPQTLRITLKSPNAALVSIISSPQFAVTDSKAMREHGGSDASDADQTDTATDWINQGNSAGTGPYRLTVWDTANEVVLEAFPDYWGDPPNFDRVIFRAVSDPNTQLQLIQTGEADLAFAIDPDAVQRVLDDPNMQILEGPSLAHEYLAMHTDPAVGGPLAKKELRQAIAYAIDYDGIINGLLGGAALRPATVVPLGLLGADEAQTMAYQTDLAKAQELFDASGVGEVELELTYGAGSATPAGLLRETLAAKLQADLQRINGLKIKLTPMDAQERLQQFREGKLQFTMSDWAADYPDVHTYADPFGRSLIGAASKRVAYSNAEVDRLLDEGIRELDPEKRKQIYVEIQRHLIEDAAYVVEFQPIYRSPASRRVQGAQPHGVYILQLRYATKTE